MPDGKNSQAWNRYSYAFNSPLIYRDPSGHCPWCIIGAIIAAALLSTGCDSHPAADETYKDQGFLLEGFDAHETQVLGGTIDAFANEVGGADQLQKLMLASNNGSPVTVRKDASQVGADAGINLGTGTFDVKASTNAHFSDWGTADNDKYAQYTFGHEISHRLIAAMRSQNEDGAEKYKNMVSPNGIPAWTGTVGDALSDFEQEAVTNLALHTLGAGYTWSTFTDGKDAAGSQRTTDINNWATGFIDDLRKFK